MPVSHMKVWENADFSKIPRTCFYLIKCRSDVCAHTCMCVHLSVVCRCVHVVFMHARVCACICTCVQFLCFSWPTLLM